MRTLDVGQKQAAYTGVIVHAGQTEDGQSIDYSVGNDTGSVLEVTVPNGTLALAYALLDKLKLRGYRYQPFEADGAIADPSIEIGDNITANNVPSIVMGINTNHSRLMASTLKAPFDEEVNHEWKYEPRSERQFKRESAYTRSRLTINENAITAEVIRASDAENVLSGRITVASDAITAEVVRATEAEGTLRSSIQINADNITAEVTRATGAEGNLSTRITQNANSITSEVTRATTAEGNLSTRITQNATSISSEVTRATNAEGNLSSRITQNATDITAKVSKSGGSSSSFAWTLTDSSWTLTSNNSTVLKATSAGIEVSGKITAKSGYIGNGSSGFEIGNTYIRNGMTSRDDTTHNGVYIGTDGIALGQGKFKVTSAGAVTASNLSITGGSISIGHDSDNNPVFEVSSWGGVTARSLNLANGLSIGSNFYVDATGDMIANSGTFKGNVYAGRIQSGQVGSVDYGTFSGSGLSDYSIGYSKYGIGSVYGGVDSYGSPTGSLAAYTVAYGNSGFTSTLDQVGTNASNITSLSNSLADKRSISNCNFDNLYLLKEGYYHSLYADYITIGGTSRKIVFWN